MKKQSSNVEIRESLVGLGVALLMMVVAFLFAHYGLGMEFFPG
ncbi:hypothetical protein [Halalkalibacter urbisdiaboli]|nr:hypothetical protein [Halalkalibacter urbisdiaboli]